MTVREGLAPIRGSEAAPILCLLPRLNWTVAHLGLFV